MPFGGNRGGGSMGGPGAGRGNNMGNGPMGGPGAGRGSSMGNGPMGGPGAGRGNSMGNGPMGGQGFVRDGSMGHGSMGGGMRPEPMTPHRNEPFGRREPAPGMMRPHHPAPFGLVLADIIWNHAHYTRLHKVLEKMTWNQPISPAEERLLWDSFGRRIEYYEAADLLAWVEREMGYF